MLAQQHTCKFVKPVSGTATTRVVRPRISATTAPSRTLGHVFGSHTWYYSVTERPQVLVRAGSSASTLELLKTEVKALEAERDTAIETAESCAKTATKLTEMARLLEQLALEKVRAGDDQGAREALEQKASVSETLEKNSTKADVNYQLAAALSSKLAEKQAAVLSAMRAAGVYSSPSATSSYYSSSNSSTSVSSSPSYSSSSSGALKWKWQQSLEEAKERLKAQEAEASREGRMATLTAEASIAAAKERIAARAQASVREAQERIRAAQAVSAGSLEAAQERLRQKDQQVLEYVRRIMSRYRRGEYVSEEELEFAFQQLEKRFIL